MKVKGKTVEDLGINSLVREVVELSQIPRMVELRDFWERFYSLKEPWKVPVTVAGSAWETSPFNFHGWSRLLNWNMLEVFEDPERYLRFMLEAMLYRFREFEDDAALTSSIPISFGTVLESSLFGIEPIFCADTDPWPGTQSQGVKPIIQREEDLEGLEPPDFYKSGLMPRVHYFYQRIEELVGDQLEVVFPLFDRGPWGIACDLMGIKNIIVGVFRQPDFIHKLMDFIVESKIRLLRERERFLGVKEDLLAGLGNDEVNCDFISPRIYKEFIFPYEQKLVNAYSKGLFYYHSCGNLTPILKYVAKLKGLRLLHISPWTDFDRAVREVKGVIFEKRLHPEQDILYSSPEQMRDKISSIMETGREAVLEIKASGLDRVPPETIKVWIKTAKESLGERALKI